MLRHLLFQIFLFDQVECQLCVHYNVGFDATVLQGDSKRPNFIIY
jgi:hypothetical protein